MLLADPRCFRSPFRHRATERHADFDTPCILSIPPSIHECTIARTSLSAQAADHRTHEYVNSRGCISSPIAITTNAIPSATARPGSMHAGAGPTRHVDLFRKSLVKPRPSTFKRPLALQSGDLKLSQPTSIYISSPPRLIHLGAAAAVVRCILECCHLFTSPRWLAPCRVNTSPQSARGKRQLEQPLVSASCFVDSSSSPPLAPLINCSPPGYCRPRRPSLLILRQSNSHCRRTIAVT